MAVKTEREQMNFAPFIQV